ncbi:MAG: hypothetical protein ACRERV_06025 [Methylococcales bacterium]
MIDHYDPKLAPDPKEWLALDEGERHILVLQFHRDARIPLPKSARSTHVAIHTIVENQLAMEDQEIVRTALVRLMEQGLNRHDAIHAIGSVLIVHLYDILYNDPKEPVFPPDHAAYYTALSQLSAEKWLHG